ncbi:MAG: TraR/DksA C4-type zinc finger protein [Patescibacteria group bacterium]
MEQDNRKKFAAVRAILVARRAIIMERAHTLLHELREKNPSCDGLKDGFDDPQVLLMIAGHDKIELRRINEALMAIDHGTTYGTCRMCGGHISIARLKAVPFAEKCLSCKKAEEEALEVLFMTPFGTASRRVTA